MDHKLVSRLVVDIFNFYSNQKVDSDTYRYCKSVQHQVTQVKNILETLHLVRLLVAEKHSAINNGEGGYFEPEAILAYHLENYFQRLEKYKPGIISLIATVHGWHVNSTVTVDAFLHKAVTEKQAYIPGMLQSIDHLLERATPSKSDITDQTGMSAADISLIESVKDAENLLKSSLDANDSYDEDKTEYYNTSVASNLEEMQAIEKQMHDNFIGVLDALYDTYCSQVPDMLE